MSKNHKGTKGRDAAKLTHLTHSEVQAVQHMFSLYDYKSTGKIPAHLARKLISLLGFDESTVETVVFSGEVTVGDVLTALDQVMPPAEPMLNSSLTTFVGLVSKPQKGGDEPTRVIVPQDISDYIESLGRPPPAMREISLMLSSMLEYDDCSTDPVVNTELFEKELLMFQKRTNALKEFR